MTPVTFLIDNSRLDKLKKYMKKLNASGSKWTRTAVILAALDIIISKELDPEDLIREISKANK
jgi:hypothetical protein